MTTKQKIVEFAAQVLKGRNLIRTASTKSAPARPTEAELAAAKSAVAAFAELLVKLATARDEFDAAVSQSRGLSKLDLAEVLASGAELPDVGSVAQSRGTAEIRLRATLQLLNRTAAEASRASGLLARETRRLCGEIMTTAETWMAPRLAEFFGEGMIPSIWPDTRMRRRLDLMVFELVKADSIPFVNAEGGTAKLPHYRIGELKEDPNEPPRLEPDSFCPVSLASHLDAGIYRHEEAVRLLDRVKTDPSSLAA